MGLWKHLVTCFTETKYVFVSYADLFKQFLNENFDVKEHANKVIQGMAISQQLGKLAEGISLLDKEIHSQVR